MQKNTLVSAARGLLNKGFAAYCGDRKDLFKSFAHFGAVN